MVFGRSGFASKAECESDAEGVQGSLTPSRTPRLNRYFRGPRVTIRTIFVRLPLNKTFAHLSESLNPVFR